MLHQLFGALVDRIHAREKAQKGVAVAHAPQHPAAQVFKHAELGENIGDLKAARQARAVDFIRFLAIYALAVQQHLAAGGCKTAADQVEQGTFTRAIRADDGDALARLHGQIGTPNNFCLAKAFAQVTQFQGIRCVLTHQMPSARWMSCSISS